MVYKKVLFEQRGEQEFSRQREPQVQNLSSGSMAVTLEDSQKVILAKVEVGKGEHFPTGYWRGNGMWRSSE